MVTARAGNGKGGGGGGGEGGGGAVTGEDCEGGWGREARGAERCTFPHDMSGITQSSKVLSSCTSHCHGADITKEGGGRRGRGLAIDMLDIIQSSNIWSGCTGHC